MSPSYWAASRPSMRRLTHYDYWQDRVRPSILLDSGADSLIYGMGEKPVVELAERLKRQQTQMDAPSFKKLIADIPQMVYLDKEVVVQEGDITLFSHEECLKDKKKEAANFRHIEEESNKYTASRILQKSGKLTVVVNPPYPPLTEAELDRSFDLPYTRLPHPKYKGKRIPAYDMIKFSVNLHRGCFGGCAFCTISAHQGKVHRKPQQGEHSERGESHHGAARLQGLFERFGRPVGQYVPHEGTG